jgi:hypothetical protein
LAKPDTVIGDAVPLALAAPGLAVTRYWVIVAPPSLEGGLKEMVALPVPATAETPVGAPGTVTKDATTFFEALAGVTAQLPVPLQSPLQPANT